MSTTDSDRLDRIEAHLDNLNGRLDQLINYAAAIANTVQGHTTAGGDVVPGILTTLQSVSADVESIERHSRG